MIDFTLERKATDRGPALITEHDHHRPLWVALAGMGAVVAVLCATLLISGGPSVVAVGGLIASLGLFVYATRHKTETDTHRSRYYNSDPDAVIQRVRLTGFGCCVEVPKLGRSETAWLWFRRFEMRGHTLRLFHERPVLDINLASLSEDDRRHLAADLSRIFAEFKAKAGAYLPHCFKCGYNLVGSPGPDCPECGQTFHRLNIPPAKRAGPS